MSEISEPSKSKIPKWPSPPENEIQQVPPPENKIQQVPPPENKIQQVPPPENKIQHVRPPENKIQRVPPAPGYEIGKRFGLQPTAAPEGKWVVPPSNRSDRPSDGATPPEEGITSPMEGSDRPIEGGYVPGKAANQLHDEAVEGLNHAAEALKAISDSRCQAGTPVLSPSLQNALQRVHDEIGAIVAGGAGQPPHMAVVVTEEMSAAEQDAKEEAAKDTADAERTSLWARFWTCFKMVNRKIWLLIAHLLTPREWSVSGEIGGGLFGMAKANIEVTFGPDLSS
jgi:hypothetical protein